MRFKNLQKGFSAVELLIVVVLVTAVALIGYMVYDRQQDKQASTTSEQSPVANDVSSAPEINQASDLDEALRVLDQNDPSTSNSDATQLDSELSNF